MTTPLVLFDGNCGLCATSVRFVLARERGTVLRFAPLQGPTAAVIMRLHPWLAGVDSLVLVEGDHVRVRSGAALGIARYLRWPWPLTRAALIIPRPVRDWLYDRIARHRHRLVGQVERIVPGDAEQRFLP